MAIGDQKVFTINDSGVVLKVTALDNGDGTVTFNIEGVSGSADINALYWSDKDNGTGDDKSIATYTDENGSDHSFNMNGTKVYWDGNVGLSQTGLKGNGADKATYLTQGDSYSTTQELDFDALLELGIRASSTSSGNGKFVTSDFEFIPAPEVVTPDYFPELNHALSYATFYFAIDDDAALAAADLKGIKLDKGGHIGDGVYTVKVEFSGAGNDLDTYYQSILDALANNENSPVSANSVVLGVSIHAGGGDPALSEVYYEVTAPNPLDHLAQNNQVDQVYSYGDLVLA